MTPTAAERDFANRERIDRERAVLAVRDDRWSRWKLRDLEAVERLLRDRPDVCLFELDTAGERVAAAVAYGDPLADDYVSVTVGGLNTNPFDAIGGMAHEANVLRLEALDLLRSQDMAGTVATVGWLGYRAPQTAYGTRLDFARGVWDVTRRTLAKRGAPALADFYREIYAAGPPERRLVAIGHSYGSLVTSYALREVTAGMIDAVVFYGSPGLDLRKWQRTSPASLNMSPGTVFAMRGDFDWVRHFAGVGFPGDPLDLSWVTRLGTAANEGPGDGKSHGPANNHADYPRTGANGFVSIAGHNVAAVLIGRPDLATAPAR